MSQAIGPPPAKYAVLDIDWGRSVTDTPQYFSIGADADVNGNGRIDAAGNLGDEGYPSPPYFILGSLLKNAVANGRYKFLRDTASVGLTTVRRFGRDWLVIQTAPSSQPHKNDLSVTTDSAKFTGFTPLLDGVNDYFPYNHTSLGDPLIAARVLQAIRSAQPMMQ